MLKLSMGVMKEVLKSKLPPTDDRSYGKMVQLKLQAAQSIMSITARVQSGMLRPAEDDGMSAVLEAVRAAQNDDQEPPEDETA